MTLKCWTSTSAIGQTPTSAVSATAAAAAADASTASSVAAMSNGNSAHAVMSIITNGGPRSSASVNHNDMRRRSVGFIDIPEDAISAASPLVTTPSRNPNVHRPSRMRSLSSTWESADFDEDDEEDKLSGTMPDLNRHDHLFTLPASSLSNNNQHDATAASNGASGSHTPGRRRGHNSRSARNRRRRTMSESSGSATTTSRRVRILTPVSNKVCFAGWVRGQPAEVQWEVVDKSVQSVRIDVCNVAWSVPTTIANRVPNDGSFQWKRVYWGMPITDGYYVNIYDVTDVSPEQLPSPDQQQSRPADQPSSSASTNGIGNQKQDTTANGGDGTGTTVRPDKIELVLLARSDCFSVVG